jgi:predicted dehydrogenase
MSRTGGPRAAVIGAGLMGRWHADAITRIGGRVALIVDPNLEALTALGRRHPSARLMTELDPAVAAAHATVAHVCSPLPTHAAVISRLIEAGIPVLAEKPLAENAETTMALLSLAERHGVMLCPVHQFLFQEGVRRLRKWLPAMGTLRRLEFSACSAGAMGSDAASLDALIAEVLPHPLSLVAMLARTPVAGLTWQVAHPAPGEFRAMAIVGDAIADLAISAHGRPTENLLRVVADRGSATLDLFHGYAVRHAPKVSRTAKVARPFVVSGRNLRAASVNLVRRAARREPAYPGLRELVRAFYAAVERRGPPPIDPNDIRDVAAARDRLLAMLTTSEDMASRPADRAR